MKGYIALRETATCLAPRHMLCYSKQECMDIIASLNIIFELDVSCGAPIYKHESFQESLSGSQPYYSLALDKESKYNDENELVLALLKPGFYCEQCSLGQDPRKVLPTVVQPASAKVMPSLLTMHHVQRYPNQHFLIGCYHSDEQLDWIMGKNDKGTNLYNVRLKRRGDTARDGALPPTYLEGLDVKFVILYRFGEEIKNDYRVFHVHHNATMSEERMKKALYPNPHGNYYCFVFDEEVELSSRIDLGKIISEAKSAPDYVDGMPIFKTGGDLLKYI